MKTISIYEAPVVISGLLSKYQKGHLWKAPEEIFGKVSEWVDIMRVRSTGGRVRFRTDTKKLWIRTTLKACTPDVNSVSYTHLIDHSPHVGCPERQYPEDQKTES